MTQKTKYIIFGIAVVLIVAAIAYRKQITGFFGYDSNERNSSVQKSSLSCKEILVIIHDLNNQLSKIDCKANTLECSKIMEQINNYKEFYQARCIKPVVIVQCDPNKPGYNTNGQIDPHCGKVPSMTCDQIKNKILEVKKVLALYPGDPKLQFQLGQLQQAFNNNNCGGPKPIAQS